MCVFVCVTLGSDVLIETISRETSRSSAYMVDSVCVCLRKRERESDREKEQLK